MPSPIVRRKQKRRGGFPFAIAIACVVCCLLVGGLIAYQKATIRRVGTGTTQDDEANGNSGLLARAVSAVLPDSDLTAVRAWLKENLNVPEWDEVRWWPAREMIEWKAGDIKSALDGVDSAMQDLAFSKENLDRAKRDFDASSQVSGPDWANFKITSAKNAVEGGRQRIEREKDEVEIVRRKPPLRLCRLKYRARNVVGATVLFNEFFEIKDGKAKKAERLNGRANGQDSHAKDFFRDEQEGD